MVKLNLEYSLKQNVGFFPKLMQSMEMIQMENHVLYEYICELATENPTMEIEPPLHSSIDALISDKKNQRINYDRPTFIHDMADYETFESIGFVDRQFENLVSFVTDQLERLVLFKGVLLLAKEIALLLDDNGYLEQQDLDDLVRSGTCAKDLEAALNTIQTLEPAGVGARDLSECLIIQLRRLRGDHQLEIKIAASYLNLLAKKQFDKISHLLKVSESDVLTAAANISKLEPRPGRLFSFEEPTVYISPDFFVEEEDGHLVVKTNDEEFPKLCVSSDYLQMASETTDSHVADYLRHKIRETQWLIGCLAHRQATLLNCGRAIVHLQHKFFQTNCQQLETVYLSDVAELTGLHISTVSRAVKDKYLQCSKGIYPIRFFLQHASSKSLGAPSSHSVKLMLRNLLEGESADKPYSDQKLTELLSIRGMHISRRTVAKYRESLGIPSSAERCR